MAGDITSSKTTAPDGEVWKGLQQGTAVVVGQLEGRIARAIDALNESPDLPIGTPTKRQVQAIVDANLRAWIILTEGNHPTAEPTIPPADMSDERRTETTDWPQAWPLYLPVDMTQPARVARPFKDVTGSLCYEWRYAGQPDRGGWMARAGWLAWVRRHGAQVHHA